LHDYHNHPPALIRELVREAGIVGMGGAGFPAHIKLNPQDHIVDTLLLNAAECEPYITCDEMLLRDHAAEVIEGLRIMRHALQARRCIIGIENDKVQAYKLLREILRQADDKDIELIQVPTVYPAGGEKQLIQVITGKEVPSKGLPLDIGVVCHNVGTAYAVYRAVIHREPLISRYVTVAGSVAKQGNYQVLIGTPIADLVQQCGGSLQTLNQVIMGGPMMGVALHSIDTPITKVTNCILVHSAVGDVPLASRSAYTLPCIRCGQCANVCPIHLLPQQLYWYARAKDFDKIQDYNLFDCIECGCCDYVCPSQIPLVHYFRYAKTEIWAHEQQKKQSDIARERHQFRELRLQREKEERAQRHKQKRADLEQGNDAEQTKKSAIEAAMERVRAKREAQPVEAKNTSNLTEQQQKLIDEVDARRKQQTAKSPEDAKS
jgi:electron transport complex protein RnfC